MDRLALERNEALHSLHVSQLQMELQSKTIEQLELSISHKKENDGALMATVLQLEEKLRKANIENQKKINMFKVEDKDKTNLIETLNDELKVKTQLIDAISKEREVSLKDINELQVSLENEKNSLKAVRSDLQTALQRDAESNETINLLRSQLQDSRVEVSELQKAMNDAESKCQSLSFRSSTLSDKVLNLESRLESSHAEVAELKLTLSDKENALNRLESILIDLKLRDDVSCNKLLQLEKQVQVSQNDIQRMERALEMKSTELIDTEAKLLQAKVQQQDFSSKNEKLEAQIVELRYEIAELEKVLDENSDELEAFRAQEMVSHEKFLKLESQLECARNDLYDLQKHSDQNNLSIKLKLEDEIQSLTHTLTVTSREKASITEMLSIKDTILSEISASHQALKTENAKLLESINCIESQLLTKSNEIQRLQETVTKQRDEVLRLSSDHSSALQSLKVSEGFVHQLKAELHGAACALEVEKQKLIESTRSNEILTDTSESRQREIDDLLDTIEQFEVHVEELKETNESKQQEIDDLLDTVEQLDVHIQELTTSYDMLKEVSEKEANAAQIHFDFEQRRAQKEIEETKFSFEAKLLSMTDELQDTLSKMRCLKNHSVALETKLKDTESALILQNENTSTLTQNFEDLVAEKQREISFLSDEINTIKQSQISSAMNLSQKEIELQETLNSLASFKNMSSSLEAELETLRKEMEKSCMDLNLVNENNSQYSISDYLSLMKDAVADFKANAISGFELANSRDSAINRLERMLAAKEKDFNAIKHNNQLLIEKVEKAKEELKEKVSDILTKDDKIRELESAMTQLELGIDMTEDRVEELQCEKEQLLKQFKSKENEYEVLTESVRSAKNTIKDLELNAAEVQKMHTSLLEEKTAHIERLQLDLDTISAEGNSWMNQTEKLQAEILQAKESYCKLEIDAQEKLLAVQEELRDQFRRNDELHDDNCILLSKLDNSIQSLENLKASMSLDNEEFSASIRKRDAEIMELKSRIIAMDDEAHRKTNRVVELQSSERELTEEILKLKQKIREIEESKANIRDLSRAEVDALHMQVKDLKSSLDAVLSDSNTKDEEIRLLNGTISELTCEIERKRSDIDSISKNHDSEVEILRDQIDSLQLSLSESQVEIQDQDFERRLLQDSIASLQNEIQIKTTEISTLTKQYEGDITSLERQLDDKTSRLACLSQKFDLMEKMTHDLKFELDEALSKQNEFQSANTEIEESMQEATRLLKSREDTIIKLRADLQDLEQKLGGLVDLPAKVEAKDVIISKLSTENQDFRATHEGLLEEIESLNNALSSKDMDIISLKELTMKLENDLKCAENDDENDANEYLSKISELEMSYQDVSARLQGAEKIAMINNKECTRLLNEIDTKTEEIRHLTQQLNSVTNERDICVSRLSELESNIKIQKSLLTQVERERDESLSRNSELESRFAAQKDLFVRLEKELQHKDAKIESLESIHDSRYHSNLKIVELEEELARCNTQIYDLQAEVDQAHVECAELRSAIEKANAESATSEEEVQLLCESIEEKERLLNSLRLQLSSFADERQELQSHLNTVQIRLEKDSFSPLSINSFDQKSDDKGQSLDLFSPSNSEVLSKHNELLDDLHRMKALIKDAISTPLSNTSSCMTPTDQNQLLSSMEDQVDVLMKDISDLKRNLTEKERLIHDLTISLERSEKEKKEIETKLLNRKNYIKQLENALSHEVKHRRAAEEALLSTEAEKGDLVLENEKKAEELQSAKLEIQSKSDAVQEQMKVARQMAKQLQITKKKIFALKKHLIENGLILPAENIVSPTIETTRTYDTTASDYSPLATDLETRLDSIIPTTPPNDYSPIVTDANCRTSATDRTPVTSNYTFSPILTKKDISNDSLNWDALSSEDEEDPSF